MAKKGRAEMAPANNLASNGVYVLMDDITMESCRECIKWIMNHNLGDNSCLLYTSPSPRDS